MLDFTGDWVFNSLSQLVQYGDTHQVFDANGNCIEKTSSQESWKYVFDIQNHLIEIQDWEGNTIAQYTYDAKGLRMAKTVSSERTLYFYDMEGLSCETNEIGEVRQCYGYLPGSKWGNNPIFLYTQNNYFFYQNDYQGNCQKLVSESGTITWEGDQDASGHFIEKTKDVGNDLRLSSQLIDRESGLHYNTYRFYDPKTGRYISQDPLFELGFSKNNYGNLIGNSMRGVFENYDHTKYSFLSSNIFRSIDPYGLCDKPHKYVVERPGAFVGFDVNWGLPIGNLLFANGGGGALAGCCDENGDYRVMAFIKLCWGGPPGGALSGGWVDGTNFSGADCKPENYEGWFGEITFAHVNYDQGLERTSTGGPTRKPSEVSETGLSTSFWGFGGCNYFYAGEKYDFKIECACTL